MIINNKQFNKHLNYCIQFDNEINSYVFSENCKNIESFENKFFSTMFGEFNELKICRYTSLKTAFVMLNNLSFRMSGLLGMNDKSEVNYVENYFKKSDENLIIEKSLIKEPQDIITELNNCYITFCS